MYAPVNVTPKRAVSNPDDSDKNVLQPLKILMQSYKPWFTALDLYKVYLLVDVWPENGIRYFYFYVND